MRIHSLIQQRRIFSLFPAPCSLLPTPYSLLPKRIICTSPN
ncbi:hypothetical protein [Moorena sp. SIO3F7]|nr:hypothetical protein [Moorena sp. SIO3F7]